MPYCTQCGHQNPADARYCARCGEPIAASVSEDTGGLGRPLREEPSEGSERGVQDTTSVMPVAEDSAATKPLSEEDAAALRALPQSSAMLIVRRGPNEGSRFLLQTDTVTAGRHPDSDIFLDDITVSRHHARFTRGSEGWQVSDNGSLNGTYVRRALIDGPTTLQHGDEIQIGKFRFVFVTSQVQG